VRDVHVDLGKVEERIRVVERAQTQGPRLEDAQVIVAGGRGLGAQQNFKLIEQLAEALGGMAGASRPLVDDGWIDSSRQVGLTGKITRPVLYIAAGISGASQHMVGCSAAKTLVAINRDPDAPVFRYARYGIVGDCLEVLPELIRAAKER
jgi:electron transfer flavoprotein alpha subunit